MEFLCCMRERWCREGRERGKPVEMNLNFYPFCSDCSVRSLPDSFSLLFKPLIGWIHTGSLFRSTWCSPQGTSQSLSLRKNIDPGKDTNLSVSSQVHRNVTALHSFTCFISLLRHLAPPSLKKSDCICLSLEKRHVKSPVWKHLSSETALPLSLRYIKPF